MQSSNRKSIIKLCAVIVLVTLLTAVVNRAVVAFPWWLIALELTLGGLVGFAAACKWGNHSHG